MPIFKPLLFKLMILMLFSLLIALTSCGGKEENHIPADDSPIPIEQTDTDVKNQWSDPTQLLEPYFKEGTPEYESIPNLRTQADNWVEWTFSGPIKGGAITVSKEWDWVTNPVEDPEFIHWMHRLPWFYRLALAYRVTGEEKYKHAFREHFSAYYSHVMTQPIPEPTNIGFEIPSLYMINVGIRTKGMVRTEILTRGSDILTEEQHQHYLELLLLQGKRLRDLLTAKASEDWFYFSNHTAIASEGALYFGIVFPQFEESDSIVKIARTTLEKCMANQVHEDGMQIEASNHYHNVAMGVLARPYLLAKAFDVSFDPSYETTLLKMLKVAEYFIHPNKISPAFSDSDRKNETASLQYYYLFDERPIFDTPENQTLGIPAMKADPERVLPRLINLPDSGYIFFRTGMDPTSHHLILDYGPTGGWHGHFDLLSFEWYANNEVLIADPGRWLYNDSPEREWIISTAAHNGICINETNHKRILISEFTPDVISLDTLEENPDGSMRITVSHKAYNEIPGEPVVSRTVAFDGHATYVLTDTVSSSEPVDAVVRHSIPFMDTTVDGDTVQVKHTDGKSLFSLVLDREASSVGVSLSVDKKWYSPMYGVKKDCKRIVLAEHGMNISWVYRLILAD